MQSTILAETEGLNTDPAFEGASTHHRLLTETAQCPLWVELGHGSFGRKADIAAPRFTAALGR